MTRTGQPGNLGKKPMDPQQITNNNTTTYGVAEVPALGPQSAGGKWITGQNRGVKIGKKVITPKTEMRLAAWNVKRRLLPESC